VLADTTSAFELRLHPDARRFSIGFPAPHQVEWALTALDVFEEAGLEAAQGRAIALAAGLAEQLAGRVARRGRSTLVSWADPDPESAVARLRSEGFVVRHLPGSPYVRASVGAWNSADELMRLAALAAG
jgi:L-cysteine/cystine lyase